MVEGALRKDLLQGMSSATRSATDRQKSHSRKGKAHLRNHGGIGFQKKDESSGSALYEHGQKHEEMDPGRHAISEKNVGYKLLKSAGWKEGTGLGAREQGRLDPIEMKCRTAQEGLGYSKERIMNPKPPKKESTSEEANVTDKLLVLDRASTFLAKVSKKEDSDTKHKRLRQIKEKEERDKKAKRIATAVYRAFRDDTDTSEANLHPLTRPRMSRTNPLL